MTTLTELRRLLDAHNAAAAEYQKPLPVDEAEYYRRRTALRDTDADLRTALDRPTITALIEVAEAVKTHGIMPYGVRAALKRLSPPVLCANPVRSARCLGARRVKVGKVSDSREVWLCFMKQETGVYTAKALYDNEFEAAAWADGVRAVYATPVVLRLDANEGEFDVAEAVERSE